MIVEKKSSHLGELARLTGPAHLHMNSSLTNLFIPLMRAEAITWENFILAKRDPSSTKEGSRLAGMKLFTCNRKI